MNKAAATVATSGRRARTGRLIPMLVLVVSISLPTIGCTPALKPDLRYVLGKPYQVGPIWFYPRESYDLDETGLATVIKSGVARLTADGEVFDQAVLAAAHPTIQLPAIACLTNLENGREIVVRVNDRGSGDPHRLVEITRRAADLLAVPPDAVARVRLRILPADSHAAADPLPGAPTLAMTAAPRGRVEVTELPPPLGIRQADRRTVPAISKVAPVEAAFTESPIRLPETVHLTATRPGKLIVRLDTFDSYRYAAAQRAKMAAAGARIVSIDQGRMHRFEVEIGPLADVAQADAVLDRALASDILDARIVVDQSVIGLSGTFIREIMSRC